MGKETNSILIKCPVCGKPSDSLAGTAYVQVIFLFLWGRVISQHVICCPECRRRILKENLFGWNILSANVVWPLWAVFLTLITLPLTYVKGHSREVKKLIESR